MIPYPGGGAIEVAKMIVCDILLNGITDSILDDLDQGLGEFGVNDVFVHKNLRKRSLT